MIFGGIVCVFKGHKRGKFMCWIDRNGVRGIGAEPLHTDGMSTIFACPRCGHETRYKVKSPQLPVPLGTPADRDDDPDYKRQDAERLGTSNHDLTPDEKLDSRVNR